MIDGSSSPAVVFIYSNTKMNYIFFKEHKMNCLFFISIYIFKQTFFYTFMYTPTTHSRKNLSNKTVKQLCEMIICKNF